MILQLTQQTMKSTMGLKYASERNGGQLRPGKSNLRPASRIVAHLMFLCGPLKFFSYIFITVLQRFSNCVPQTYIFLETTTFLRRKSKNRSQIKSEDVIITLLLLGVRKLWTHRIIKYTFQKKFFFAYTE